MAFKKKPRSFLHQELHPGIVHFGLGLGGFLTGLLLLGAIGVSAETSDLGLGTQVAQLRADIAVLHNRLTDAEARLAHIDGGEAQANGRVIRGPLASCESLAAGLPNASWAERIDTIICSQLVPPGSLDTNVLAVSARFLVQDATGNTAPYTVHIYDLGTDASARTAFLAEGAVATTHADTRREQASLETLEGTFTYDGSPIDDMRYHNGALWLVHRDRFAFSLTGDTDTATDRRELENLAGAINLEALGSIQ